MKPGDLCRLWDSPCPIGLILTKETDSRYPGVNFYRILWSGKIPEDYYGSPTAKFSEELIKQL